MSKNTPHQLIIPIPMKKNKPKTPSPSPPPPTPMELLNSGTGDTWKFFTLGTFFGLFLFTILLTTTPNSLFVSSSRSSLFSSSTKTASVSACCGAETEATTVITAPASAPKQAETEAVLVNSTTSTSTAPASAPKQAETEAATVNSTTSTSNASTSALLESEAEAISEVNSTTMSTTMTSDAYNSTELVEFKNSTNTLEDKLFTSSMSSRDQGEVVAAAVEVGPTVNSKEGGGGQKCKMYEGRWVHKPEENPRYRENQCPFLEEKMSCQRNGRPDFDYEAWSWESDDCQIPLFDGKDMLERMIGKRMIIVGDSLNRNKWESLACLLYTSVSPKRVHVNAGDPSYKVLKALDYGFTLEFYWAPFLVDYNPNHPSGRRVLTLDRLDPASDKWRGADVMVFNSGHWWTHDRGRFKPYDVFEYNGTQVDKIQTELAYSRALSTWATWLSHNVDPTKTKVYFRSISPEHKNADFCFNHSRPIPDNSYTQLYPRTMIHVIESKLREINGGEGVHVSYLNITKLSSYRRDAHPGIFRFKNWRIITAKYKRLIPVRSDCSHWCLPGLPDTWNRILYASLFYDGFAPGEV